MSTVPSSSVLDVNRRTASRLAVAALATSGLLLGGLSTPAASAATLAWTADLRVDANRDGVVDVTGTTDTAAEASSRALFLANLDDDSDRCADPVQVNPKQSPKAYKAEVLAQNAPLDGCADAKDSIVNGPEDARDLASILTPGQPSLPADATGQITTNNDKIRIFVADSSNPATATWQEVTPATRLTAAQLRAGVRLGVEGKDIVRDAASWDGSAAINLSITGGGATRTDSVTMQVAPALVHHHGQSVDRVLSPAPMNKDDSDLISFNKELAKTVKTAGMPPEGITKMPDEFWQQDYLEALYTSIPGPTGPQAMRLLLRSDQDRTATQRLYLLRGPGIGVLWLGEQKGSNTLDSFGNLEVIPPYTHNGQSFPQGRVIIGDQERFDNHPSERLMTLLAGQNASAGPAVGPQPGGAQAPLLLDTAWLGVGHVDEYLSFVPAANSRHGWKVVVADPMAGIKLLRKISAAGQGNVHATGNNLVSDSRTVNDLLRPGTKGALGINHYAATQIEANLDKVKQATGITEADVIRIPMVYDGEQPGAQKSGSKKAATKNKVEVGVGPGSTVTDSRPNEPRSLGSVVPGIVNSLVLDHTVVAPRQWTPRVGGKDLFERAARAAYAKAGMKVAYVDDLATFHASGGEIHCGTNTFRTMIETWWK